jgi:hypothetical protein
MYQNLGIQWASSIPAFLALACVPMPFLFYRFGKVIRARSKYAARAKGINAQILNQTKEEEKKTEGAEGEGDRESKNLRDGS